MSTNNKYHMMDAQRLEGSSRFKKVGLSEEKMMVEERTDMSFCAALQCELHMLLYSNVIQWRDSQVLLRFIPSLVVQHSICNLDE